MDVAAEHQNLSEATAAFEELRKAWEAQGHPGPMGPMVWKISSLLSNNPFLSLNIIVKMM